MLRGFWAMTIKEFRQLSRDRTTIIIAVLIPVIQLTIFGYAIRTDVTNVSTVIMDMSHNEASRELVSALDNTGVFKIKRYVVSYGSAYDAIRDGKTKVAIIIPPGFSSNPLRKPSTFQVLVDGSDSTVANYVMGAVEGVAASLSKRSAGAIRARPMFVSQARVLFNPELKSARFFVPGLIVLILHMPLVVLTSLSMVREKAEGTLEQLIVTPIGPLGLMLGKLVPFFCIGALAGIGILLVMVFIFKVPISGSLPLLILVLFFWVLVSLALGLMLSTIARTQLQAMLMAILTIVPSILLSGFIFPRESMPAPIYPITLLLPMTYAVNVVRGLVIRGADLTALARDIGVLIAMCITLLSIATFRFQKRLE